VTRVLLVHQPTDGGVGRHVSDLANGLAARGYEVTLCGPLLPAGIVGDERVRHVTLDLRRAIAPTADMGALRQLSRVVRDTRPDVIHAHSSKAGALVRLGRISQPRVPVLYTPHGYAFAGYFSSEAERRGYREIERLLAPLATRVVCVCEAEARLAAALGSKRRVRVVYNGIDAQQVGPIDPLMQELARRGPVVCALTQLRAGKGIETLIDAAPSMLERHPDLQIAIWGDGPELEPLRNRARAAGVEDAVHFPGASSDPLTVLRGTQVFVHPSLAESFPYVVLEAMAVGAPIVASDVGGIGEAVVDGNSAVLVAPGDAHALATALLGALGDVDRATKMGEAARARFDRCFTLDQMLDGLVRVYNEVTPPQR
jgi:glycosyltransferase involved in cell wall biosynthesis